MIYLERHLSLNCLPQPGGQAQTIDIVEANHETLEAVVRTVMNDIGEREFSTRIGVTITEARGFLDWLKHLSS
jgi:hypothetical protein